MAISQLQKKVVCVPVSAWGTGRVSPQQNGLLLWSSVIPLTPVRLQLSTNKTCELG